jgi:hypothetical protein
VKQRARTLSRACTMVSRCLCRSCRMDTPSSSVSSSTCGASSFGVSVAL